MQQHLFFSDTDTLLPKQLIHKGKLKQYLPKVTFPSDFNITCTANHLLNLETCKQLFQFIIFPYLSTKKREPDYPEEQHALIFMNTFKGQDNNEGKLFQENKCELVIVSHKLCNKFQPLDINVNQSTLFNLILNIYFQQFST